MSNPDLEKYIASSREQNIGDEEIKSHLIKAGWSEGEVLEALNPIPTVAPNIPPPPVPRVGMWVGFEYVILFIALYISATSIGGILHYAVDKYIPDVLKSSDIGAYVGATFSDILLKGYLAALIVAFPIFALLFVLLKKEVINKPVVKSLRARKLLFYITLVGTFLIMIWHLITTIFGFLNGVTSVNSVAHLAVTFLVAGSIFVYLLVEVKEDRKT